MIVYWSTEEFSRTSAWRSARRAAAPAWLPCSTLVPSAWGDPVSYRQTCFLVRRCVDRVGSVRVADVEIEDLLVRWKIESELRPPRSRQEREEFEAEVLKRTGIVIPGDYRKFLTLCDGGQYDAYCLWGVGPEEPVLGRCEGLDAGDVLIIGDSGNVDAYRMYPDGHCDIVNFFKIGFPSECSKLFPCP
jgi:hypothetical protein